MKESSGVVIQCRNDACHLQKLCSSFTVRGDREVPQCGFI